jgi:hypothetical protein
MSTQTHERPPPPTWAAVQAQDWFEQIGMEARERALDKWAEIQRDHLRETGELDDEREKRLEREVQRYRRLLPPTTGERVRSAAAAAGRGFAETAPALMESASVARQVVTGDEQPAEDQPMFQRAQRLRERIEEALPTDPRVREEFVAEALPSAMGSFVSYIIGGGLAGAGTRLGARALLSQAARQPSRAKWGFVRPERLPQVAQTVGSMGYALGAAGGSGLSQAYREAREFGADEQDSRLAGILGILAGGLQVIPVMRALERLNRASRGAIERSIKSYLREGARGGVEEAIAETAGQTGFNLIAQRIYDQERELLHGLVKAGGAGGIAGFLASFVLSAIGGGRGGLPTVGELRETVRTGRQPTSVERLKRREDEETQQPDREDEPIATETETSAIPPAEREGVRALQARLRQMTPDRPEASAPTERVPAEAARRPERQERPPRDFSEAMPAAVGTLQQMDLSAAELDALDRNLRYIVSKPKTWRQKPENISRLLGQTVLRRLHNQDKQPLVDEFANRQRGREALEAFRGQIETLAHQRREAEPAAPEPEPAPEPAPAESAEPEIVRPERWHELTWQQVQEQARMQGIGARTARRRHVEAIQKAEEAGELVADLIRAPYRQVLDQQAAARERAELERRAEEGDQEAQEAIMREAETAAIGHDADPGTELLAVARRVKLPAPQAAEGMNLRGEAEALQRHFSRAEIPRYFTTRTRTDAELLEQFAEEGHHFDTVAELMDAVETRIETGREVYGTGEGTAARFARRTPEEVPTAPAEYVGRMEGARGQTVDLYNLTEDVGETPSGSTVSAEFLQQAGYRLPESPEAAESGASAIAEEIRRGLPIDAVMERTGLHVEVIERQAQLPARLLEEAAGDIIDGATVGRRVYLVAENLGNLQYAERKLAHEVVGHIGLRAVMGERFDGFLDEAYRVFSEDSQLAESIARITRNYEIDVATADGRRLLAEELIAEMAEGGPVNRTVLDRIVEAVRRFLREMGLDVQMSEADILAALDAARALTMPEGGAGEARFARRGVPEVSRETFAGRDGWRHARDWASTNIEGRTVRNNASGMEIRLTRQGIKHGTMPTATPEKLAAVRVLPELIEQGRYVGRRADNRGRPEIQAWHQVDAPIRIDGTPYNAEIFIREVAEGNLYYDHVVIREQDSLAPGDFGRRPPSAQAEGEATGQDTTPPQEGQDAEPRFARRRDEDLNDSEAAVTDTFRVPPEELSTRRLQERYNWLTEEIDRATEAGDNRRVNQLLGPRSEARVELANRRQRQNRDIEETNPAPVERPGTEQENDLGAAGIDTSDLIAPTINRMLTLRAFHESGTDTLYRSGLFRPLASAIENQLDKRDGYRGALYGIMRPGIRAMRGLSRAERRRVKQEFEQFWAENDVGDKGVAGEILERAHPQTRELVEQWRIAAAEAFRIARGVGVKVQDPESGQVQEMGQVQDYFPRMLNQEAERALAEPHRHPETWNRLVDALIAEGHIQQREEAQRYINEYFSDETTNDFFANIERHRKQPLPRIFYDYSISRAVDYINRFSERTSQIEFYGQVVERGDRDLFDQYIAETTDRTSREYVDAIRKRIYNQNPRDFTTNIMANLNMLAAGSMLGNPLTASRNLVGGMTLTAENYGLLRSARELWHEIRNYNQHATEAYERGILKSDLLHVIRDNDMAHTTIFGLQLSDGLRKYTDFMMKYGGYTPTENFIRVHAMLTSKSFIGDAIRTVNANPTSSSALRYRAFFQRNRIDLESILRDGLDSAAGDAALRRMVKIPQGSYEVDNVPVFIDTAMGRFLFKYQKFGTQVSRFFFRNMFSPFIRALGPGENVRVRMPDGTETTARVKNFVPLLRFFSVGAVGGLAMQGLIHLMFGSHPRGPSLEEIEQALDDDETARGLALMMDRAYMAWLYSGGAGVYGNYIQAGLDVYRRQRVRSPADPPGLDALSRVYELGLRYSEQGTLTATDIRRTAIEFNSGYRAWSHFAMTQADRAGADWKQAQLYAAWRERQWAQGVVGRYADEMGIEGRIRAAGRMSRSEMSPVNQRLYDAVMLGNAAEARAIAEDYLRGLETRDAMQRAYQSMQSSIRARQPLRVISSAGEADRLLFLEWAQQNLGPGDMERLRRLDGTYRDAAIRAGLLTGDEARAEREIQRREYRTRELPEHQRQRAVREIVR